MNAPVTPVWMTLLTNREPAPASPMSAPVVETRFDELLNEVFGGTGRASRSLTSHLDGQEKASKKSRQGQGIETTPLGELGPFVDGSGPEALVSVSQVMGFGFDMSFGDTPVPPPRQTDGQRPMLQLVPSWTEPTHAPSTASSAPRAPSASGEAVSVELPSLRGDEPDLGLELELIGFEPAAMTQTPTVQARTMGPMTTHAAPLGESERLAYAAPTFPTMAPVVRQRPHLDSSPQRGIPSVAIPRAIPSALANPPTPDGVSDVSNLVADTHAEVAQHQGASSDERREQRSDDSPPEAVSEPTSTLDGLETASEPTTDVPSGFEVISAARPTGAFGSFRSAHHTAPASMPPLPQWVEQAEVATDGELGDVTVRVDDDVSVGVYVDAERVRVVVDTTVDAAQSLAGLQAELQQELADSGRTFDYEQRSSEDGEAKSRGLSGEATKGSAPAPVARGKLVNRIV